MVVAVLTALGLLVVGPFVAALADLVAQPEALAQMLSGRILALWGATVGLGLVTAALSVLVGTPVGWFLARTPGRWSGLLALLLPLPLVLPPWIVGLAWIQVLPLSGFWGAAFLLTASLWPFVALFALRGFRAAGRPAEAAILARGARASWRRVELPLALPSILSGALLVFIFAITDFGVVDFLSFSSPQPFVVLSSEIFQKWARLDSGAGAAAVSLLSVVPALGALAGLLTLERRHAGRASGALPSPVRARRAGAAGGLGLTLLAVSAGVPLFVLTGWAAGSDAPGATLGAARDSVLTSLGVAATTGLFVGALGALVAHLSLTWPRRAGSLLLGLSLLPLAAPGVMFGVGQIRFWNHAWNPLADAVYPSAALLVLGLVGRYLSLGVLAARAVLARQDVGPWQAVRLVRRPWWQRLLRIQLPLLGPAMGMACALGYLLSMRELDMITVIPAGTRTLAHRIFSLVHIAADEITALLCLTLVVLVLVPAAAARLLGVPGVDCPPSAGHT